MTLAKILLKLWALRIWVAIGLVPAGAVAAASVEMSHSTIYSIASTQILVDSPTSGLASSGGASGAEAAMQGLAAQASVFARLMTSSGVLQYIGKAAGIQGNLIDATGPFETNGSPVASHSPIETNGAPAPGLYKLSLVQNPSLPTVDVYAAAPTTKQAIALANGAVSGFTTFIAQVDGRTVPASQRISIRQLGAATGGPVDPSASKSTALLIFIGVFAAWCGGVLFVSRLRAQMRAAKRSGDADEFALPLDPFTTADAGVMAPSRSFTGETHFGPSGNGHRASSDEESLRENSGNGNGHGAAPADLMRRLVRPTSTMLADRSRPHRSIADISDSSDLDRGAPGEGDAGTEFAPRA